MFVFLKEIWILTITNRNFSAKIVWLGFEKSLIDNDQQRNSYFLRLNKSNIKNAAEPKSILLPKIGWLINCE
jgi:hypothetical protein